MNDFIEQEVQTMETQPVTEEVLDARYEEPIVAPIQGDGSESIGQTAPVIEEAPVVAEPALKVGDRVRIFIDPPGGAAQVGTVRVVQTVPGKTVGVELDSFTDRCHSLDGLVEERVDETRGVVVGKGWWTREENVEVFK